MAAAAETIPPGHSLQRVLDYRFKQPQLLEHALTHRSVSGGRKGAAEGEVVTNERLEFLGDRVLGLVIAEALLTKFPREVEGQVAQRLAALVAEPTLAAVARGLNLGRHVKAAPGQDAESIDAILADACEAVVGALYLDGGLPAARTFILTHWEPRINLAGAPPKDAKSALQEWAQGQGLALPKYREASRSGPDHAPVFTCVVAVEGFAEQEGSGKSKQAAETAAATAFLDNRK